MAGTVMQTHRSALLAVAVACALARTSQAQLDTSSSAVGTAADLALVSALAPEATNARFLTPEDLTAEQRERLKPVAGLPSRFAGDFNADGWEDLALVGRYGNVATGSFVLIATREGDGWRRAALKLFDGDFIVGLASSTRLAVFFCLSCDSGRRIVWDGAEYRLESFPDAGVPDDSSAAR
jgi:hypothetical protein